MNYIVVALFYLLSISSLFINKHAYSLTNNQMEAKYELPELMDRNYIFLTDQGFVHVGLKSQKTETTTQPATKSYRDRFFAGYPDWLRSKVYLNSCGQAQEPFETDSFDVTSIFSLGVYFGSDCKNFAVFNKNTSKITISTDGTRRSFYHSSQFPSTLLATFSPDGKTYALIHTTSSGRTLRIGNDLAFGPFVGTELLTEVAFMETEKEYFRAPVSEESRKTMDDVMTKLTKLVGESTVFQEIPYRTQQDH